MTTANSAHRFDIICCLGLIFLIISGCENKFQTGKDLAAKGDRKQAVQYFKQVSSEDKDYSSAQEYIKRIEHELTVAEADSEYSQGNYEIAAETYLRLSRDSSANVETFEIKTTNWNKLFATRHRVCRKMLELQQVRGKGAQFSWLRRVLSDYNKRVFGKYEMLDPVGNYIFDLYNSGIEEGRFRGAFTQAVGYPWGNDEVLMWHGGYYWDGSDFMVMIRYVWRGHGVKDFYLSSPIEIPKRRFQTFLIQFVGLTNMTTEFGQKTTTPKLEIVATLGSNRLVKHEYDGGYDYRLHPDDEELTLTTTSLTHYLEKVLSLEPSGL